MKNKTFILMISLINYGLISIYTLYLASLSNSFYSNFSDLYGQLGYSNLIFAWSIWTSISFGCSLYLIRLRLHKWLIVITVLLLNVACLWPYNPTDSLLLAQIHILLAYISFGLLTISIVYELYYYSSIDLKYGRLSLNLVFICLGLLVVLFMVVGGVNSIFETSYTILIEGLLILVYYWRNKDD